MIWFLRVHLSLQTLSVDVYVAWHWSPICLVVSLCPVPLLVLLNWYWSFSWVVLEYHLVFIAVILRWYRAGTLMDVFRILFEVCFEVCFNLKSTFRASLIGCLWLICGSFSYQKFLTSSWFHCRKYCKFNFRTCESSVIKRQSYFVFFRYMLRKSNHKNCLFQIKWLVLHLW